MGRDSSGHICPWCSLGHHRSPLAAWRSCVPVSSRQDIPVGWGWVGDTQQQHPQDPARAWLSSCVRLRARTQRCREGRLAQPLAGWGPLRAAAPQGWGWPHSVGTCEPRNSCASCGRGGGTSGSLVGGQPQLRAPRCVCWHELLGSHFGSTKMCVSKWKQVLENGFSIVSCLAQSR